MKEDQEVTKRAEVEVQIVNRNQDLNRLPVERRQVVADQNRQPIEKHRVVVAADQ